MPHIPKAFLMPKLQSTTDRLELVLKEMNKAAGGYVRSKGDRSRALKCYIMTLNRLTDLILSDLTENVFKRRRRLCTRATVPSEPRKVLPGSGHTFR